MGSSPTDRRPPEGWKPNDDGSWWPRPPRPKPTGPAIRSKRGRADKVDRIKRQVEAMKGKADAT